MSTAIAKNFQVGSDSTATNNFTIRQPATPDGTVRIANGNSGTTTDLVTVTSAGNVGVGTTSPSFPLDIASSTANIRVAPSTTTNNALTRYVNAGGTGFVGLDNSVAGLTSAYALNLYHTGAYPINFSTNGTLRMTLDSSGNLGIGTSSPGARLDLLASTSGTVARFKATGAYGSVAADNTGTTGGGTFAARQNGTQYAIFGVDGAIQGNTSTDTAIFAEGSNIKLYTNGVPTVRATLDSSGNLGLGVTPSAWSAGKAFEMSAVGNGVWCSPDTYLIRNCYYNGGWKYASTAAAANYYIDSTGQHIWSRAPSGTAGNAISFTQAMTLDASGKLAIGSTNVYDGAMLSITTPSQTFSFIADGGTTSNKSRGGFYHPSANVFALNVDGASGVLAFTQNATERARITSDGNLLVGTTSSAGVARVTITGGSIVANAPTSASSGTYSLADNGSSPNTLRLYNNTDSNNTTNRFLICDAAASVLRAEIRSNGGIANYSANNVSLSDRREKTNFAPAKSYLDTICAIPVQTFNYIDQNMEDDPGLTLGVVAQDVQTVAPEFVTESNWGTKEDPKMRLSIYQTDLQYALMKCIQELKAELDSVKTELALLKGTA